VGFPAVFKLRVICVTIKQSYNRGCTIPSNLNARKPGEAAGPRRLLGRPARRRRGWYKNYGY
jgi:hypothetical protein